jgi:hypothetical protein
MNALLMRKVASKYTPNQVTRDQLTVQENDLKVNCIRNKW